ncbi:MAG: FG-GAP-like repeat-containing protein, partial [Pirellulales bacterium]|nr:FG-GAP-like repeat-containing protein [Pirellulales bacterium]
YPIQKFDPRKYSNNFITMTHDVNGDGYVDVLVNEWPGKAVHWFENPQGKAPWKKHLAHAAVDNESPQLGDITGDGKPELLFHTGGQLGYASLDTSDPTGPWRFTPVSEKEKWGRYQHGIGIGDVNGDGTNDYLMVGGWWAQPKSAGADTLWKKHAEKFGTRGGAQMYAYDVDGDGDNDIITSLDGHGFGLVWFENVKDGDNITFKQHVITGNKPEDNPYGVKFSQIHAICLADMDGDGLKDIITGKRYWAHGPKGDPEPGAPAVLYWFKLARKNDGSVEYIPYLIDDDSGVGTQFAVGDVNGDGNPDVVIGNKKGGYAFLQQVKNVDREEWQKEQPVRIQGR